MMSHSSQLPDLLPSFRECVPSHFNVRHFQQGLSYLSCTALRRVFKMWKLCHMTATPLLLTTGDQVRGTKGSIYLSLYHGQLTLFTCYRELKSMDPSIYSCKTQFTRLAACYPLTTCKTIIFINTYSTYRTVATLHHTILYLIYRSPTLST